METYYANISVIKSSCYVCEYDMFMYYTTNVHKLQYCFKGVIYDNKCGNYNNKFDVGLMFPIQLFIGKKEGDQVKLSFYNEATIYREAESFDIIVTCKGKKDLFQSELYQQASKMDYYCIFQSNRNLQNLIAYNTYTLYCNSLNFTNKLTYTSYEPNHLIDYINIENKDVLNVIKLYYNDVFTNQTPIPFYV